MFCYIQTSQNFSIISFSKYDMDKFALHLVFDQDFVSFGFTTAEKTVEHNEFTETKWEYFSISGMNGAWPWDWVERLKICVYRTIFRIKRILVYLLKWTSYLRVLHRWWLFGRLAYGTIPTDDEHSGFSVAPACAYKSAKQIVQHQLRIVNSVFIFRHS